MTLLAARSLAPLVALIAATFAAGCGIIFGTLPGPAMAQQLTIEASQEELHQAALQYAEAQEGWTITKSTQTKVVAVTAIDESGGMITRDKWLFQARDGVISARLFLEFNEGGRWDSIDLVSQNYSYFREHEHLRQISQQTIKNRVQATR